MAQVTQKVTLKVLTIIISIPVGMATKKAVERAWTAARPPDAPREPSERGVRWGDAIGWAALSAAGVVVAELLSRKGAEEVYRTLMGTEPPKPAPSNAARKLEKAKEPAPASS